MQLRRIDSYIRCHLAVPIRLEDLAREVAASPFHFAKRFRAATAAAPHQYVVARRMERAMDLLRRSRCTVAEVAAAVGYREVGHFRRQFRAHWGQSPGRRSRQPTVMAAVRSEDTTAADASSSDEHKK